jgi:hypothetical protein
MACASVLVSNMGDDFGLKGWVRIDLWKREVYSDSRKVYAVLLGAVTFRRLVKGYAHGGCLPPLWVVFFF